MKKPTHKPRPARQLTDKPLAVVVGGRLDNAPINVVSDSDYNSDSGG
jgi:hypothetical protein